MDDPGEPDTRNRRIQLGVNDETWESIGERIEAFCLKVYKDA